MGLHKILGSRTPCSENSLCFSLSSYGKMQYCVTIILQMFASIKHRVSGAFLNMVSCRLLCIRVIILLLLVVLVIKLHGETTESSIFIHSLLTTIL